MSDAASFRHQKTSLIGSELSSVPYLSPFGRLYRLSRLNSLWLHQFPSMFGTPPLVQRMLRIGHRIPWEALHTWDATSLTEDPCIQSARKDWYPYKNEIDFDYRGMCGTDDDSQTKLRGCPTCFAYGYHTMLHQLPWISICPWHREFLVDTCTCGRPLLQKAQPSARVKLLACVCGKDHFDRSRALLGMDQWPTAEVHQSLTAYLRVAENERRRTTLISSDKSARSEAYARIEPAIVMQPRQSPYPRQSAKSHEYEIFATKTFDESATDAMLSDEIVYAILRSWAQARDPCSWGAVRTPITSSCYERIRQYACEVNLEASREFGISELVDISTSGVYAQRRSIADTGSGYDCCPAVDGWIIGPRLGRLGQMLFLHVYRHFRDVVEGHCGRAQRRSVLEALVSWARTSQAQTLALALSEITTLIVVDHLRGILQIAPSIENMASYRIDLGAPIMLVRDEPELKIIVGYTPPSLRSIVSARNCP